MSLSSTTRTFAKDLKQRTAALKDQLKALVNSLSFIQGIKMRGKNCGVVSSKLVMQHDN